MSKHRISLQQLPRKDGGFYHLKPPPKTFFEKIKEITGRIIFFPYHVYQTLIGRLLSYLVINPLFRKEEQDEALILQNSKFPDPLFCQEDELFIINVYPKKHIITRTLLNWHNFLVNYFTPVEIINSFLKKIINLLPNSKQSINDYLDSLVEQVANQIESKNPPQFKANQIHFRGLERLDEDQLALFYQKLELRLHYDFRQNQQKIYFFTLQTTDNATLDSVEIRNTEAINQNISERHFIIAPMPRSNNFVDWIKNYQIYAKNLDATIITFNYRGIGLSTGLVTNQESLYADAYAQAQRLLKLGARPENIAFMGECLGGNVATHTAGTLQAEGLPVKLFNARSFRSITAIVEGKSQPDKKAPLWNPLTWLSWLNFAMVKLVIIPIIHSAHWELNIEKEFQAIPPQDRDYLVVRSKKNNEGNRFADDRMIPHKTASTYSLVKQQIKAILKKKQQGAELSALEKEWLKDTPKQHKFYVSEKLHQKASTANGHTVHSRLLVSTNPDQDNDQSDGRQYTFNFFHRIWPNSSTEPDQTYDHTQALSNSSLAIFP